MNRIHKIAAAACLAAAAVAAQAADFYIGGSAGSSRWDVEDDPAFSIDKRDTGAKLFGGIALHSNFAIEAGYAWLGKAKFSGLGISGDVKGTGFFVDAVGLLPLGQKFSLLGKVGAFRGKADGTVTGLGSTDDSGTDIKWGLGAAYSFSPSTAVRVEWERYRFDVFDDKGDVDFLSLGVTFKF
jgi:OOP family OmpA-OmpF porin